MVFMLGERNVLIPLALPHSPSGCAIRCMAVGEIPIGISTFVPRTVVDWSRQDTSRINRGRILNLSV
jgi:hypothetical protein